ncbi:hypothetical protein NI389_13705 [Pseudoalteromonas xiamenensis]|uniref:hypothetical protein n=1 Tax=Pseudoalteromonas xiamenensis TaxID=882626 RepID=UPI0027E5B5D5|nr:hypothetical protein [Pseudoalteromonas xiamenensis]WMN59256.1 hypothetical protein NI389_13705 [Pseudoalteromonas xiamenensis]
MQTTLTTIKEIRHSLKRWGTFWKLRECGKGFNKQNMSFVQTPKQSRHSASDSIYEPEFIATFTAQIQRLEPKCIQALRAKYVAALPYALAINQYGFESKKSADYWLHRAERTLMTQLS